MRRTTNVTLMDLYWNWQMFKLYADILFKHQLIRDYYYYQEQHERAQLQEHKDLHNERSISQFQSTNSSTKNRTKKPILKITQIGGLKK
jgi:hypothetical protein